MKSECGTLSFLAPEVFKGTANSGPPLDVWALGVVLFTMLCGKLPFDDHDMNKKSSYTTSYFFKGVLNTLIEGNAILRQL